MKTKSASVLAVAVLLLITGLAVKKYDGREAGGEVPGFDYFYAQRAFPYGKIDYEAHRQAAASYVHSAAVRRNTLSATWQFAGPSNIGGRISDIEMHPADQNIAYLAASSGGVFKTTDAGVSWFPIFDTEVSLSMGDIALAPSNPDIVYVGTGEANGGSGSLTYDANGVYKSTDGGLTWTHLGLELTRMTGKMAVHPTDPDIVFAATMGDMYGSGPDRGLYRSADGGTTWSQVLFLTDSTGCIDVVINPQNPNYVFAAMFERSRKPNNKRYFGVSSGLWRSTDGGLTWSQLTNGLPAVGGLYSRIAVDLCETSPSVVYTQYVDDNYEFMGMYKSTDNGNSWTQTNDAGLSGSQGSAGFWYGKIRVDPTDPDIVFAIGFDMYKTETGGNSWGPSFPNVHVDQHAIAVHPLNNDFVMNGNDGGLYISQDGGSNWNHHKDLPITQFYTCELDESDPKVLVGGTQDNNTVRTLTGSFFDWDYLIGGDGFYALIDPANNNYWYGEFQYGNIFRSDDGGQNFSYKTTGLTGTGNWNTPIVFMPNNTQTLFTGYQQVFRTNNRGDNWFPISPNLTTIDPNGNLLYGTITTIDVSTLNTDIIYAGTDDGKVWVTTDGGNNWNIVSGSLPVRWVTRITCDPFVPSRAYVSLSGYRFHDQMAHVYMTSNNGTSWQDISGNLPDIPCNDIIADPTMDSVLYLATDAGVYYTTDMGTGWNVAGTGMPVLVCNDLRLHVPSATLLVGTYGRGMYKMSTSVLLDVRGERKRLSGLNLFPVPAKDYLDIAFDSPGPARGRVEILDLAGRQLAVVYEGPFTAGRNAFRWEPDRLAGGACLVVVTANGSAVSGKAILAQ